MLARVSMDRIVSGAGSLWCARSCRVDRLGNFLRRIVDIARYRFIASMTNEKAYVLPRRTDGPGVDRGLTVVIAPRD